MGCDIHIITEIRKEGKWQFVKEFPEALDHRNYSLFAFLAGVRDYFNYDGFEPKGLPEDMSGKKFFFRSEREFYTQRYNEGDMMFIGPDGVILETSKCDCMRHLTEDEYNQLQAEQKENNEEFAKRYQYLGYSCSRGVYDYHVYDAQVKGGCFEKTPYSKIYPDLETFLKERYADEWDEDAQDYGYWGVNFEYCKEYGDYHTPSYLSLQEMLDKDTTSYTSHRYKMDRTFYNAFIEAGGVFPEKFKIEGDTKPGDIAECVREAFEPTIIVSWQKTKEEQKEQAYFQGIEQLKEIAKKYDITDYNDIRIVFAFDN